MNLFGISQRSFGLIREAFQKYPEVEDVLIFGSRAKGTHRPGSDIDLAIIGTKCSEHTALNIAGYLNEEVPIPYFVDVVHYDGLKHQDLKAHIDRVGKSLFGDGEPKHIS
jgi:predicted nucleotidyltransferase